MGSNYQLPLDFDQHSPEGLENFVIYRSSAGSGKTHTLVLEYLDLVLKNPTDYQHILAITFTNKAASEMKERILKELTLISAGKQSVIRSQLEKSFKEQKIEADLTIRARKALEAILFDYGNLSIGTLDHFFTQLVRGLARELNLPLRYDIDVDNQKAVDFAVEELYEEIDSDEQIRNWLAEFTFNRLENDKNWRVDQSLQMLGMDLFNENFHVGLAGDPLPVQEFQDLVDDLIKTTRAFKSTLKGKAREALTAIETSGLKEGDFKRGTVSVFNKILSDNYELSVTFRKILYGEDKWYTQKSDKKNLIDRLANDKLNQLATDIVDYLEKFEQKYTTAKELLKNVFSLGILGRLNEQLKKYRDEKNIILLADNTFLLRSVIQDDDAPFLYEKLGSWYKHIMIDEFQDTSIYQWKNILPLVKNSVSSWWKVLIVGDVKQSIYRWRGGDMSLLLYGVQEDLQTFKSQIQTKLLADNYRSAPEIVAFNNRFFELAVNKLIETKDLPDNQTLIQDAYRTHSQNVQREELRGYVEVQFVGAGEEDWKKETMNLVLKEIDQLRRDGFKLGEIMILVDRIDPGREIATFLLEHGIPVITESAVQVQQSRVVQLILNALKWLRDPYDTLARTNLLLIYCEINKVPIDHSQILTVDNRALFESTLPDGFQNRRASMQMLPLYEIVENLIVELKLQKMNDRFLMRFLDVCIEQGTWGRNDVFSFLKWWEENKEEIKILLPEGEESVEIMTIHKAKGLEKSVVMLPFANYLVKPLSNGIFWTSILPDPYQKYKLLPFNFVNDVRDSEFRDAYEHELLEGMLERLNVIYVALTRPRERLYVYPLESKKIEDVTQLNKLLKSVLHDPQMDLGHLDAELNRYSFGSKSARLKAVDQEQGAVRTLDSVISTAGNNKYKIKDHSNEFWKVSTSDTAASVRRGLIVHEILSRIEGPEDIEKAILQSRNSGLIDEDEIKEMSATVNEIVNSPDLSDVFDTDWEVLNEQDIYLNGSNLRPDRILLQGSEAKVIDFKTGEIKEEHSAQIQSYAQVLQKLGYSAESILLYINDSGGFERIEVK